MNVRLGEKEPGPARRDRSQSSVRAARQESVDDFYRLKSLVDALLAEPA